MLQKDEKNINNNSEDDVEDFEEFAEFYGLNKNEDEPEELDFNS